MREHIKLLPNILIMGKKILLFLGIILVIIFGLNLFELDWFQSKNEQIKELPKSVIAYQNNIDEILKEKNVMLFFSATWCPTCKALKKDIINNQKIIPEDLIIIEADYDTEIELRKKYNVTVQHTLVFLNKEQQAVGTFMGITKIQRLVDEYYKLIDEGKLEGNLENKSNTTEDKEYGFLKYNLKTNTAKISIPFKLILSGGPEKDGIPAIDETNFIETSHQNTQKGLKDNTMGISVKVGSEIKFYPYSILYWHEIVNDKIGDKKISVTFCPLCGTAIVYNREINGEERIFGVSGKLYESNLLMYDNKNESLWSQSIGEAVVGDDLGKKLEVIKSDVMSFSQFKNNYPNGLILSEDTGYSRNYARTPYGSYETEEDLYFPVKNTSSKLHQKELMYVLPYNGESYAFVRSELINVGALEYSLGDQMLHIVFENGEITASVGDKVIPGYIEMWFSWFTQHPDNKNVWTGE